MSLGNPEKSDSISGSDEISDLGALFLSEKMKGSTGGDRWTFKEKYTVGGWRCRSGRQDSSWGHQDIEKGYPYRRRQNKDSNRNRLEKEKFKYGHKLHFSC